MEFSKIFKTYDFKKLFQYTTNEIYRKVFFNLLQNSYSQNGEDLTIDSLLNFPKTGFYVDVGANHPDRFSNTKRFYKRGWNGINIEPNPDLFVHFPKRTRDINLNIGVDSKDSTSLRFYRFFPNTLSTFSAETAERYRNMGYDLVDIVESEVRTLERIFEEYAQNKTIDFLNIDVEGMEMEVLKGNNWGKYRPKVICLEAVEHSLEGDGKSKVFEQLSYLNQFEYELVYHNGINAIYKICNL